MSSKVDLAVELMVEEAKGKKIPEDFVSRLYQVEMEVISKINEIMRKKREEERDGQEAGALS